MTSHYVHAHEHTCAPCYQDTNASLPDHISADKLQLGVLRHCKLASACARPPSHSASLHLLSTQLPASCLDLLGDPRTRGTGRGNTSG
jgi:hypothetical protein